MHLLRDASVGAWLLERVGAWATVGGVAGNGFDAYARLLNPLAAHHEDQTTQDQWGVHPDDEHTRWPWAEVARRNDRVMHPLVQWRRISDEEHTRWWPDGWRVDQSDDGWFDPQDLAVLTEHLRVATTTPEDVVVGAWVGTGEFTDSETAGTVHGDRRTSDVLEWPGRDIALFQSSIEELANPEWAQRAVPGWTTTSRYDQEAPHTTFIWPSDHAWVVASEEDWDSTIVAGTRDLIDRVLADDRFEAYDVHEDSDLSWDGDHINLPQPQ